MSSETLRQLEKMDRLIEEYPMLTAVAAGKIYDWLDGQNIFEKDSGLHNKTRKQQADELINWFENRINDMRAGIQP